MRERGRRWALLFATYVTMVETLNILWTGRLALSAEMLTTAVVVPAAQFGALELADILAHAFRNGAAGTHASRASQFFLVWPVLFFSITVATFATTVAVFRSVDLTGLMASVLLLTPTAQAGVIVWSSNPRAPWLPLLRRVVAHPLAGSVLWLDVVMLPAGWLFPHHPLWGMSVAAILQRRWMATKFVAASACFVVFAFRSAGSSQRERAVLIALALALAGIGSDGFAPWIFDVAFRIPPPFSSQPLTFLWLEVYGGAIILLVALSLRARRTVSPVSADAGSLVTAAAVVVFLATLTLMMNGFFSIQPIEPWAGLALTCASVAGTLFATAALLAAASSGPTRAN